MNDRPEHFRNRGGQGMQDSGVGSFGSESDSSPVQNGAAGSAAVGVPPTSLGIHGQRQVPAPLLATASVPTDRTVKPTISIIPQSPTLVDSDGDQSNFSFEKGTINTMFQERRPSTQSNDPKPGVSGGGSEKIYRITYCGESVLDRRYTRPMLPWIMAEIRRNLRKCDIELQVLKKEHILQARSCATSSVIFEHKLATVSSFARAHQDPKCFTYLTRSHVDAAFTCHVFQTAHEEMVPELFTSIREATKEAIRDAHQNVQSPDCSTEPAHVSSSHLCEVMYVGKVVVTSKKAPPTFIDEAVEKFREHERQKVEVTAEDRRRHSSGNSIQSLPADLEQVALRENELSAQTPKGSGSSDINISDEDVDSTDNIPLGGSSSSFLLSQKVREANRKMSLESSFPSDLHLVSNSQDSIKNTLTLMGQGEGHKVEAHEADSLQKMVLQSQIHVKKNRTMLIQVGQNDICLISTDRKKVIFERKFTDISFCSQGIEHPEHFGFISRDLVNNNFMCYVFRCATESLVEEVMQTLKQAFHTAYQQNAKNHVVCELCPMHQLHKLCQEVDKQTIERTHEILIRRVEQLSERDRQDVMEEYRTKGGSSIQEKNETLMGILRHMSEEKQREHVHISDTNRAKYEFILVDLGSESISHGSKFDQFKSKAKKSLTNSFDNILHRRPRSDDHREHVRHRTESESSCFSHPSVDSSLGTTPDMTPLTSPLVKDVHDQFPTPYLEHQAAPRRQRSRSTTVLATQGLLTSEERGLILNRDRVRDDIVRLFGDTSPLKSMFNRVASSMNNSALSNQSPPGSKGMLQAVTPLSHVSAGLSSGLGSGSWRMDILNRVVTPAKTPRNPAPRDRLTSTEEREIAVETTRTRRLRWRHLWKKAILETLLLIRMEKENSSLQARQDEVEVRRLKLDYEEITPCLKEVTKVWDRMLTSPVRALLKFDHSELNNAVKDGVPRGKRGDIWQLLIQQHELHNPQLSANQEAGGMSSSYTGGQSLYEDLLKQLTTHQHAILIDLGRTFPGHPYFTTQLGPGQLALFNLLKAYSLLDKEVGYCQGLSFVAGILLMHMPEEMAFHTMKYMMNQMGFRRQYRPDMVALQIQLYQLSRLLHDYYRDLYEHLEKHEIAPTLYAAPWFLTVFASQFPLGFVARVFDLIFLQGMEVVFKVALVLLGNHKELIKQCDSFETIMEFLKSTLPGMGIIQMERVINQVFQLDLSKQLHAYEVEYHVLQEEMMTTPHRGESDVISRLEQANHNLKRQNLELLEQLQTARSQCTSLESQTQSMQSDHTKLKSHIRTLELERAALLNAVAKLRKLVPEDVLEAANISIPPVNADKTLTNSPIHNPLVNRFLEDLDLKFTSSSLTEVDREVSALMAAKHRKLSDQGQHLNGPVQGRAPPQSRSNEYLLTVEAAHQQGRPASSNY